MHDPGLDVRSQLRRGNIIVGVHLNRRRSNRIGCIDVAITPDSVAACEGTCTRYPRHAVNRVRPVFKRIHHTKICLTKQGQRGSRIRDRIRIECGIQWSAQNASRSVRIADGYEFQYHLLHAIGVEKGDTTCPLCRTGRQITEGSVDDTGTRGGY